MLKNFYGLAAVAALSVALSAQITTITQSTNNATITPLNSVACATAAGFHVDNSYWRSYNLAAAGVTTPIDIVSIRFGIEQATSPAGNQPAIIRLYLDTNPQPGQIILGATLIPIHTENITVVNAANTFVTQAMTGAPVTVLPTDTLVVEFNTPTGATLSNSFFMGSNNAGETAPGFISAAGCGINVPSTFASIGFPNVAIILDVNYVFAGTGAFYPGTGEDLALLTGIGTNAPTGGTGNDIKTCVGGDLVTFLCTTPAGGFAQNEILLVGQLFITGNPPVGAFPGLSINTFGGFIMLGGAATPFGPLVLPIGGFQATFLVPPFLGGSNVSGIFQYLALSTFATNGFFAATDAHEIQVL